MLRHVAAVGAHALCTRICETTRALPFLVQEHIAVATAYRQVSTSSRRMPLVRLYTPNGDGVRVRCELHTPWTQLIDHPRCNKPEAAVATAGAASGFGASPAGSAAVSAPADDSAHAGGDSASLQLRQRQDPPSGQAQSSRHLQFHGDVMVNDPQRAKLLIVASLGVEGGSGWFSHVAQHFVELRDPTTGQPAADVVTFDNRRRWSTHPGSPPPRQGLSGYSSEAMAADALALLDALGWQRAHLVGMSLGAMVAAKAAAAAPKRTESLTLLGYTLNGWQMAASLVTRPDRLLPVILGSERSRVRATLPFYFTRRFLDAPLPPRWQQGAAAATTAAAASSTLQAAKRHWPGSEGSSRAGADIETGGGQHSSGSSTCSSEGGGDVPVTGGRGSRSRQLTQVLLGRRRRPAPDVQAPIVTREDAILANQALAREAVHSGGGNPPGSAASRGGASAVPRPSSFARAADAALGEAGPGGSAASRAAAAADPDEASLPDTGLASHSLACLLHWLTKTEQRTIADAGFPATLLVGRHDPVSPVKWVQHAAAKLRGTLVVTEASHAGLTVESCPEVLSSLELSVFGRTLGDRGGWRAVQDAAIAEAVTNPHLIKR